MCQRTAILLLFVVLAGSARAQYLFSGRIEYERKINVHNLYADDRWFDRNKSEIAKFHTTYFNLYFDTSTVLYRPGREVDNPNKWVTGPANDNIVCTQLATRQVTALKNVYEASFLVCDSAHHYRWKEKPEMRNIAGHPCHKAVTVICDSVYVVAFYTEDIPAPAGPEMFGGLPGMILELAIPRLHTTWVATKIESLSATDVLTPPNKGKKVNSRQLLESVQNSFKDWGNAASRNIWWIAL
ncbi:MAG: GLPGLI family protein [Chitinophagia bacterium]|nr:GLPGLI family protein [Chitinophagia bacterium]